MKFDAPEGATPLDPNEVEGLLLTHITTRAELDRWEQENIAEAEAWAFRRAHPDILTDGFARRLHKRMFGNVWRWAGLYRKTGKNIGISAWEIATELRKLCDDCKTWIECGSYPPDEIAVSSMSNHCAPPTGTIVSRYWPLSGRRQRKYRELCWQDINKSKNISQLMRSGAFMA